MKFSKSSCVAITVSCLVPAFAAEISPRSDRAAWRDAFNFLGLSNTQMDVVRSARADHARELFELASEATKLGTRKAAAPTETDALSKKLCQRSQALEATFRAKVRAPLSDDQLKRLTQLEQAMALLPVIESAQAAGLIADRISAPVVGLPTGSVDAEYIWRRQPASPLPGCPASVVHREVELENGSRLQPKPKK